MTEIFQCCTFDNNIQAVPSSTTDLDMELLIKELGDKARGIHLMLVGDGSGNTANDPCGFACVAYDRVRGTVTVHRGGYNHGTNNFAELMPYVHALWHYRTTNPDPQLETSVLVVSDSELTVNQGKRKYRRAANACLWAAIDWFEENGFHFEWRHVYRNTNPVNTACDRIAGQVRKSFINGNQ